jgi:hypothetical protein
LRPGIARVLRKHVAILEREIAEIGRVLINHASLRSPHLVQAGLGRRGQMILMPKQ